MFTVIVSQTFQKQFKRLDEDVQRRIKLALKKLEENPFESRSGVDIKLLGGTKPKKHRLRVGEYRIIYFVEGSFVKIIEVFSGGRGYRI